MTLQSHCSQREAYYKTLIAVSTQVPRYKKKTRKFIAVYKADSTFRVLNLEKNCEPKAIGKNSLEFKTGAIKKFLLKNQVTNISSGDSLYYQQRHRTICLFYS
jgi:hypothetical protein